MQTEIAIHLDDILKKLDVALDKQAELNQQRTKRLDEELSNGEYSHTPHTLTVSAPHNSY